MGTEINSQSQTIDNMPQLTFAEELALLNATDPYNPDEHHNEVDEATMEALTRYDEERNKHKRRTIKYIGN